jgi:hypothetical protein
MGGYVRFYKPRSEKYTNEWLMRPCIVPYNATAELFLSPPISPPIVLPESFQVS